MSSQLKYEGYTVFGDTSKSQFINKKKTKKDNRSFFERISFSNRLRLIVILITVMLFLLVVVMYSLTWSHYFNNFNQENLKIYSDSMSKELEDIYAQEGRWNDKATQYIELFGFTRVGIAAMLSDADGNIVARSLNTDFIERIKNSPSYIDPNRESGNISYTTLTLDSQPIGELMLWMYSDSSLAKQEDLSFMLDTFAYLFIALGICLFLAVLSSHFAIKVLSRPLEKLVYAAKQLGKGDLSVRAEIPGNDEIAFLGSTFDQTVASLENIRKTERQLTHNIAHELKTPLASMQATIEAMIDGVYEPTNDRLNVLDLEVKRLSRLVGAMLDLARIENRRISMNIERIDLSTVVRNCIRIHKALFADLNIKLSYEIEDNIFVNGDKDLLLQAITNIISNSFRYTKAGGEVKVKLYSENNYSRFVVTDTGIGISEEDQQKLFVRFFRANDASEIEECGSGVGLSIVKEIVEIHNGWIAVKSKKGEGSSFIIGQPLADANFDKIDSDNKKVRNIVSGNRKKANKKK